MLTLAFSWKHDSGTNDNKACNAPFVFNTLS